MTEPTAYLLRELARAKDENRRLRRSVRNLEESRDYWRARAGNRERKGLPFMAGYDPRRNAARKREAVQATGRAEAH